MSTSEVKSDEARTTQTSTGIVSSAPSTVPPPPRAKTGSTPPHTPFPFSARGERRTGTTGHRKSVRFHEKPMLALYKPSIPDIQSSVESHLQPSLGSKSDRLQSIQTTGQSAGKSLKVGTMSGGLGNTTLGPSVDKGFSVVNMSAKTVTDGAVVKVKKMMKKQMLAMQRQSTFNLNNVDSEKAEENFFTSPFSPIPTASKENLTATATDTKTAKTEGEEDHPSSVSQTVPGADKVKSNEAREDWDSTGATASDGAAQQDVETVSTDVFKVPTNPAPSRHKSYFKGKSRSGDNKDKTISTIPKRPQKRIPAPRIETDTDVSSIKQCRNLFGKKDEEAEELSTTPKVPLKRAAPSIESEISSIKQCSDLIGQKDEEADDLSTIPKRPPKRNPPQSFWTAAPSGKKTRNFFGKDKDSESEKLSTIPEKPQKRLPPPSFEFWEKDKTIDQDQTSQAKKEHPAMATLDMLCDKTAARRYNKFSKPSYMFGKETPRENTKTRTTPAVSSISGRGTGLRTLGLTNLLSATPISRTESSQVVSKKQIQKPTVGGNQEKITEVKDSGWGATEKSSAAPSGISSVQPPQQTKVPEVTAEDGLFGGRIKDVADAVETGTLYNKARISRKTTDKLMSFTLKLKNLTDPGKSSKASTKKRMTRQDLVTPRHTKTASPESRCKSAATTNMTMTMDIPEPRSFAAVYEGTGSAAGEVGVASFFLNSPGLVVCQFSDSKNYPLTMTKLRSINPSQILVPEGATGNAIKLYEDIEARMTNSKVVRVLRKHFNEKAGLTRIQQLVVPEFASVQMQFNNKYYCMAAAAALLKVISITNCHFFSAVT